MVTLLLLLASLACAQDQVQLQPSATTEATLDAWTPSGGEWALDQSVLRQEAPWYSENAWEQTAHCFLRQPAFADFTVEFEFRVDPGSSGVGAAQFLFRATDNRTYYLIQFSAAASGVFLVREDPTTHWANIKRAYNVSMPRGKWHTAKVSASGSVLQVFVNGTRVLEATDRALQAGLLGFGSSTTRAQFRNLKVSGETAQLAPPWRNLGGKAVAPDYKVLCQDAGAGGYEAFPDVCRCANGDLLCVFYAGYGHVSFPREDLPKGARVCAVRSSDDGKSWGPAQIVADTPWDDRDPSICCLRDGTLLCNWFTYYGNFRAPEGDKTFRYKELWLAVSTDHGRTWSEPRLIEHMAGAYYGCSSPILELHDGTLLWPVYREYQKPLRNWSAVLRSTDKGLTWSEPNWVDLGNDDNDEPSLIEMPDHRVLCVMRNNNPDSMWYSWSSDGGVTWTKSRKTGFPGNSPYLFRTREGVLLLGHRIPQTALTYSLDDGATWSKPFQMDITGGAYPSMVTLEDGSVLFVYYEEGEGSSIRAQKIRVSAAGIEQLKW